MRKPGIFWLLLSFMVSALSSNPSYAQNDQQRYLQSTTFINTGHPSIVKKTASLTATAATDREKAVRIHNFVRDNITFGWHGKFYKQKASEVLRAGIGFCNTKGTLFVTMLRAAGIPARQRFVNINTRIVRDFISPGTSYVDHSYTEVFLDERWIAVDSYIVDTALFEAARAKLVAENRLLGYGIHRNGTVNWDGKSDAFSQFLNDGSVADLTTSDYGVYPDIIAFYADGKGINKLNAMTSVFIRLAVGGANRKIAGVRASAS